MPRRNFHICTHRQFVFKQKNRKYKFVQLIYTFLITVFNQSFVMIMLLHDMVIYLFDPYDITAQYVEIV
jgi:hypothetical protein